MKYLKKFLNKKHTVVVRTDGGISSQIAFYAYGRELELRGFDVYYDTNFYNVNGMDSTKQQVRNYDMERAFPNIHTKTIDPKQARRFRHRYRKSGILASDVHGNTYVSGYPTDRKYLSIKHIQFFRDNFNPIDAELCHDTLERINATPSCGIHVRRGDLSDYNPAYGFPPSVDYYLRAIEIVKTYNKDVKFFFFSDGMDWVRNEIIPKLPNGTQYELVDGFGADKGYLDLYVMSHTDFVISSQGSFGNVAALLSKKCPLLILSRNVPDVLANYPNCIYINEDVKQMQLHEQKEEIND